MAAPLPDAVRQSERKIYWDMVTVMMAAETANKDNGSRCWHINTDRIAVALPAPCQCTGTSARQAKTLSFGALCEFLNQYHSLTKQSKACLFFTRTTLLV